MKISKNSYLIGFVSIVLVLAMLRLIIPSVASGIRRDNLSNNNNLNDSCLTDTAKDKITNNDELKNDADEPAKVDNQSHQERPQVAENEGKRDIVKNGGGEVAPLNNYPVFITNNGKVVKNRIVSVPSYSVAFPDSNHVQIVAAKRFGVQPVSDRNEAEGRKKELVCMNLSPFYRVDRMRQSIPYLVPRASVLLNDIGRAFYDSLQNKGVPLHQLIVTSVLRTKDDVKRLRNYNTNATENSCHMFGTTFDISYNRFATVHNPGENRRSVSNDTLKWVLSEVLNDLRLNNRCYVKYERKQGCFHITTR